MAEIRDKAMQCVTRAKATWGSKAWDLLSERQRKAEVALEVCALLSANDDGPLSKAGCIAYRALEEVSEEVTSD